MASLLRQINDLAAAEAKPETRSCDKKHIRETVLSHVQIDILLPKTGETKFDRRSM
jgi:hypothetical protein